MSIEKATEHFKGDDLAASVWSSKYAAEGEETPDDMHLRMAREFARIDENYQTKEIDKSNLSHYGKNRASLTEDSIFNLFKDFKYIIPQGRVMSGLGVYDSYRSLSNCLRLPPPKDSYSSILYVDTMLVSSAKRGCGYGLGVSNLRPAETDVRNSANSSTGAVSFMGRYSNSTREVAQSGRRGACLLDINIKHPDSLAFINSKKDRTKITGANISIKAVDTFFEAVENKKDFILSFPCELDIRLDSEIKIEDLEYNKLTKGTLGYYKKIKANEYFDEIVNNAWENAEPGLFFWDRVINYDPCSVYEEYQIDGTNACGEQPMCIFDTCRLILINLFSFIKNPFTSKAEVDFDLLYAMAYEQMRLGDNLVDLEIIYLDRIIEKIKLDPEPIEEKQIELTLWNNVKEIAKNGRRVGCGITALGDMIAALGLKYDSDESIKTIDLVMKTKMQAELDCSTDLAILRGVFKGWNTNREFFEEESLNIIGKTYLRGQNDFYDMLVDDFPIQTERLRKFGRRNINWSTIAPAGTVSLMTQSTSGCEPLFQPFYTRRTKINAADKNKRVDFVDQNGDSWMEYPVLHPKFKEWMDLYFKENDMDGIYEKEDLQSYFEISPYYLSTANDIDWSKRILIQSILQKYTTSAISTTLNLPNNVTKEEVAKIYMESWKLGLKGQTIYRDGCRTGVLVTDTPKHEHTSFTSVNAIKRPKKLKSNVHTIVSKGVKWNVIVGMLEEKPYEVFAIHAVTDKKDDCITFKGGGKYTLYEGENVIVDDITSGMNHEEETITRLISTNLRHGTDVKFLVEQLNKTNGEITSFSKAIARTLKTYIPSGTISSENCPVCSSKMVFEEGCKKCSCGYSAC